MPQMLKEQGYKTYCVGKWYLAPSDTINTAGPYGQWPLGRGFKRYYGFLESHTSQWYPDLVAGNTRIYPPSTPEEGYSPLPRPGSSEQGWDKVRNEILESGHAQALAPHLKPLDKMLKYKPITSMRRHQIISDF